MNESILNKLLSLRMFWLLPVLILTLVLTPIVDMYGDKSQRLYIVILSTVLLVSAVHVSSDHWFGQIVGVALAII